MKKLLNEGRLDGLVGVLTVRNDSLIISYGSEGGEAARVDFPTL